MVTLKPANAANAVIGYQSSAPHIATVNGLGCVTTLAPGTAKITVKAGKYTKTVTVLAQ